MAMLRQLSLLAVVATLSACASAQPEPSASPSLIEPPAATAYPGLRPIMARKLGHAQLLLGAIVRNDFQAMSENAEALGRLSQQAEWQVRDSMSYQLLSSEFRQTARTLAAAATRRDAEAAFEHYIQLTRTCVECHKHVREGGGVLRGEDVIRTLAPATPAYKKSKS